MTLNFRLAFEVLVPPRRAAPVPKIPFYFEPFQLSCSVVGFEFLEFANFGTSPANRSRFAVELESLFFYI